MIVVGYLLAALFFLTAFLFVVWFGSKGAHWRSLGTPLLIVGTFGIMAVLVSRCAVDIELEWNPAIRSDAEVFGTWGDRAKTVVLRPDHTLDYWDNARLTSGTWTRNDWNLFIYDEGHKVRTMEFVKYRGHLRLMPDPPGDPDAWNGDVGLEKSAR